MPRPQKPATRRPARAELQAQREDLDKPLTPPRPWLKETARDPRLRAALLRNIERRLLTG
jgi:hypothetical protein